MSIDYDKVDNAIQTYVEMCMISSGPPIIWDTLYRRFHDLVISCSPEENRLISIAASSLTTHPDSWPLMADYVASIFDSSHPLNCGT